MTPHPPQPPRSEAPTHPGETQIEAALDRELPDDEQARLRAHVAACAACSSRYGSWFELEAWAPGIRDVTASPGANLGTSVDDPRSLALEAAPSVRSLDGSRASPRFARPLARWLGLTGWSTAAAVVIGLGLATFDALRTEAAVPPDPPVSIQARPLLLRSAQRVQERRRSDEHIVVHTTAHEGHFAVQTQVFQGDRLRRQSRETNPGPLLDETLPSLSLAWSSR